MLSSGFAPNAEQLTGPGIRVVGFDWGGKTIQTKSISASELVEDRLPIEFWDEWTSKCSWYEVIGGSRPIHKLKLRRDAIQREIGKLRLEPQSVEVIERVRSFNEEVKHLEEHSQFLQRGFVKHRAEFRKDGRPFDISAPIPSQDVVNGGFLVEVSAERVGLGSGVHLWVTCYRKDEPKTGKIDEFQSFFPCDFGGRQRNDSGLQWPSPECTDINIGDLANSLQLVYIDRNPSFHSNSQPLLRFCGRWLSAPERGPEVFGCCEAEELYSEKIDLFIDMETEDGLRPRSMLELSRRRLHQRGVGGKRRMQAVAALIR